MREFEIRAAEYSAIITAQGAALRQFRHKDRDLVVPFPAGGPVPDCRGVIAAPWPNRIEDGSYTFDGLRHQLPVNEPERGCALHGLVFSEDWTVEDKTGSAVTLSCLIEPTPGYPFRLRMLARYQLDDSGLAIQVEATNVGPGTAPYGICPHPYLVAGPAPLDEWSLHVPADAFLDVTPDRLLPTSVRKVAGHRFDFRTARTIGTTEIDHAFTDLDFDMRGCARLIVRDPGGSGVGMEWDRTCPWLQIHTADKKPPFPSRIGLAVEPMTCPPDAFNSAVDLVRLEPDATHNTSWRIFAV